MNLRTRAFGAPVLAVALAFLGGTALSASFAQAADRIAPRTNRGGFLGVRTQELTSDLRDSYDYRGDGVLVSGVSSDTPAERLGIKEGDIITEVDGRSVDSPEDLASRIRAKGAGSFVSITVWRDGRERSLGRISLADAADMGNAPAPPPPPDMDDSPRAPGPPAPPAAPRRHVRVYRQDRDDSDSRDEADKRDDTDKDDDHDMGDLHELHGLEGLQGLQGLQGLRGLGGMMALGRGRLGVELSDLDSDLGQYFHTRSGHGVLVTRVLDDTPAARAGLKAGDVIVEFDGKSVGDGDDLRRLVNDQGAGDVDIRIERRGDERTLTAHLGEREAMGNLQWRSAPGDKGKTRVYRYELPNRGEMGGRWQGMSDEDRAQLRKDMQQMRKDLARMRQEMRERMQKGDDGDDDHHDGDRTKDKDDDEDDDGN